jgi:hypothetical protein
MKSPEIARLSRRMYSCIIVTCNDPGKPIIGSHHLL